MATANINTILDGTKKRIIHIELIGATGQFADEVIYDYSADVNKPDDSVAGSTKILSFHAFGDFGSDFQVSFDGTTDYEALAFSGTLSDKDDFSQFGGIPNFATAPTGDITLTSTGFSANKTANLILEIGK